MPSRAESLIQGRNQITAGAGRCDDERGTTGHLPLRSSRSSVYRIDSCQRVPRQIMTNDCRQTSDAGASSIDHSCGGIAELIRFGSRFGRFGSVWSTSTKSKSHDGEGVLFNLVDLVEIHTGGTRVRAMRGRAAVRAGARLQFPPSVNIDQIDQIAKHRTAVRRFSFGRREPNGPNQRPIWSTREPNRPDRRLVRGRSR